MVSLWDKRVLGVLAGQDMPLPILDAWARSADAIFAADGARNRLHELGIRPYRTVGDFDSIHSQHLAIAEDLHHVPDQDSSDCDKLLRLAEREGVRKLTLASVEGDRPDHVLATLHSATKVPLEVRIAYRTGIGMILRSGTDRHFSVKPGMTVSVLPLEACDGVTLEGVRWPLTNERLTAGGAISLSNVAENESIRAALQSGVALIYIGVGPDPIW